MTEKHLRTLVELWQRRLGLKDWTLVVNLIDQPRANGRSSHMTTHRSTYYQRAVIEVGKASLNHTLMVESIEKDLIMGGAIEPHEYVEISIVHELLHLWNRDMVEAADLVTEEIHPNARPVWDEAFRRAEERMVESLAIALVRNWGQ